MKGRVLFIVWHQRTPAPVKGSADKERKMVLELIG
jgi:hypothetical protein